MFSRFMFAFLVSSSVALASGEECIEVPNDLDRLACYDKALGRTPLRQMERMADSEWILATEKSKLTDQTSVFLRVDSKESIDCGWNRGDKISLWIRCHENVTALVISTGCHMTSSDYNDFGDVTYRIDDAKAQTVRMDESTNNRSLGLWRGNRSIPVIKQMFDSSSLVVRMTPFGQNPFIATFNIAGLKEAIAPLRAACHW